jgi:cbb3-type cytochrome oxidase subunit 3
LVPDTDPIPEDSVKFIQRIYLEQLNIGRRTVFGEPRLRGVRDMVNTRFIPNPRNHTRFYHDAQLDVTYSKRTSGPLRYEALSFRVKRNPLELRAIDTPYPPYIEHYLQLPEMDSRVAALARLVTRNKTNNYDKAAAIEKYLIKEYSYSLEGGHDPADPLSDFLFKRKSGHCEYFSTAFVVMARLSGIAARPVGGFYGGVYNDVGDFIAVRQADAHSWAEVYFTGMGWITFDPTPASEVLVGANVGFFASMGRYYDSLELQWYKWVIRWNLERQLEFLREIGRHIPAIDGIFSLKGRDRRRAMRRFGQNLISIVLGIAALVLVFLLLRVWRRRRRAGARLSPLNLRNDPDAKATRRLYTRLLKLMKKRGLAVGPSVTTEGVSSALEEYDPELAQVATPLIDCYQDVVFGCEALKPHQLSECKRSIEELRAAL